MQRLEWYCHTKSVSGALYKAILFHGNSNGSLLGLQIFTYRAITHLLQRELKTYST